MQCKQKLLLKPSCTLHGCSIPGLSVTLTTGKANLLKEMWNSEMWCGFSSLILKIGDMGTIRQPVNTLSSQCVIIIETLKDLLMGWYKLIYFEQKLSVHSAGMRRGHVSSTRVVSQGGDIVGSKERMLQDLTTAEKILSWSFLVRSSSGVNQARFTNAKMFLDAVSSFPASKLMFIEAPSCTY